MFFLFSLTRWLNYYISKIFSHFHRALVAHISSHPLFFVFLDTNTQFNYNKCSAVQRFHPRDHQSSQQITTQSIIKYQSEIRFPARMRVSNEIWKCSNVSRSSFNSNRCIQSQYCAITFVTPISCAFSPSLFTQSGDPKQLSSLNSRWKPNPNPNRRAPIYNNIESKVFKCNYLCSDYSLSLSLVPSRLETEKVWMTSILPLLSDIKSPMYQVHTESEHVIRCSLHHHHVSCESNFGIRNFQFEQNAQEKSMFSSQ